MNEYISNQCCSIATLKTNRKYQRGQCTFIKAKCPLVTRDTQLRATMENHLESVRMARMEDRPQQVWQKMWNKGDPRALLAAVEIGTPTSEVALAEFSLLMTQHFPSPTGTHTKPKDPSTSTNTHSKDKLCL